MRSELEQYCSFLLKIATPTWRWEEEYAFAVPRRFRFDFANLERKIAIECEGGSFSGGAHIRGVHFRSDSRKYNLAVTNGWKVLRYTKEMLESGELLDDLKRLEDNSGGKV